MNELLQSGGVRGVLIVDRYKFNPNHVIPFEHEETAILKGNSSRSSVVSNHCFIQCAFIALELQSVQPTHR